MPTKVCNATKGCAQEKDIVEFSKCGKKKDGTNKYKNICKECHNNITKQYNLNNPEKVKERRKRYSLNNPEKLKERRKRYREKNPEKVKESREKYLLNNIEKIMLNRSRRRAKQRALEHNITLEDIIIPEYCPVLGIKIEKNIGKAYKNGQPNSPSIDRIENSKGYIKGNIMIISHRANSLKNDATIEELEKVLAYMKEQDAIVKQQRDPTTDR